MPWRPPLLAAIAALAAAAAPTHAQCEPQWSSAFGAQELNGPVRAIVRHNDGAGESVFVGGDFTAAGDLGVGHIARWDGRAWWDLAGGLNGRVLSMAVFDEDGPGPARPALFVAGEFTQAGEIPAAGLARWDGVSWSAVGGGVQGAVLTLAAAASPQHRGLYVGGELQSAGGVPVQGLARWDGSAWTPIGPGLSGPVHAITEFDLGDGVAIYAGGAFTHTGDGAPAQRIAR